MKPTYGVRVISTGVIKRNFNLLLISQCKYIAATYKNAPFDLQGRTKSDRHTHLRAFCRIFRNYIVKEKTAVH